MGVTLGENYYGVKRREVSLDWAKEKHNAESSSNH